MYINIYHQPCLGFVIFIVRVITESGIFWLVLTSLVDDLGALDMHRLGKLLELDYLVYGGCCGCYKRGGGLNLQLR